MRFVGGFTPYECGRREKKLSLGFFTIGGQTCHISNVNYSKPEVEIDKLSRGFLTALWGLQSALFRFRMGAPQVGDIAKVPHPPNLTPIFSKSVRQILLIFTHFRLLLHPLQHAKSGGANGGQKISGWIQVIFRFFGLTPKLKIWVPTATGGLVGPLEGHLSP